MESQDTETQDAATLTRTVLDQVRPGSIVLFHDGGPPKPGTIEALGSKVISGVRAPVMGPRGWGRSLAA